MVTCNRIPPQTRDSQFGSLGNILKGKVQRLP